MLIATGFSKWGMSGGTAAALVLADAVLERDNPWRTVFDSGRLGAEILGPSRLKENAKSAIAMVAAHLPGGATGSVEELQPGQAAIVRTDGAKFATYRDAGGTVHSVSAECTHQGCIVAWNNAELSWDCPCHGSRFDCDGHVIEGPAVRDLGP